ncbi:MAG: menaquinone biosynthesis decarboxylase [Candidatus Methanoperedens sp.]|nr:menaquinone biosynthesis decarboxylase [Candidatus Methanoperedens sp.]MCZ7405884.1 menaquinone biosynthesis decarboxylase [Candidatus Methanoperedens sp.]
MAYKDLREFIEVLEKKGLLKRIKTEVSAELEITEILDRVVKNNGPALLFENVKGYKHPVFANAFGTMERMCLALGVNNLDEIGERIRKLLEFEAPSSLWEGIKMIPKVAEITSFPPKHVNSGPCKEVILKEGFSLDDFPVLKCWPEDGGRFITLPLVFTKNQKTGKQNVGMYRMQVYDGKTTGMHWHIHKHGARDYADAEGDGKIEVAVAIGADPAVVYSATAPLPDNIDEMMFAGFIRKKNVELVKCETVDLYVPAHAEIILEGYVDAGERRIEGPFGDHTGYYSLADEFPVFHITCITHRKNPIYHATVVGIPPMEDAYLGKATERIFLPLMKAQLPEIVDINLPVEAVFHNLCIVSIKKRYPGHAKKVMFALWGMGQMMFAKTIIVLDDDVNVQDMKEVLWATTTRMDPASDVTIIDMAPTDTLDHASPLPNLGSKMGIDATRKGVDEGFNREWPDALKMNGEVKTRIDTIWKEMGL